MRTLDSRSVLIENEIHDELYPKVQAVAHGRIGMMFKLPQNVGWSMP